MLSASNSQSWDNSGGGISWYENHCSQDFTPHVITTNVSKAQLVYAIEVNGDGDIDVVSASESDHNIAWYENKLK